MSVEYSEEYLNLLDSLKLPDDLDELAKTVDGKAAIITGQMQGKADRLHNREYNPPEESKDPEKWSFDSL